MSTTSATRCVDRGTPGRSLDGSNGVSRNSPLTSAPTPTGNEATNVRVDQLSAVQSVWMHLLPGVLILLFALVAGPVIVHLGLPLLFVPSLWVLAVLIPFELGYLLVKGWQRNGRLSLDGVVVYRKPMPFRHYAFLVPLLMGWAIIAFLVLTPHLHAFLFNELFRWVPDWFVGLFAVPTLHGPAPRVLVVAVVLYFIANPAAALVEELYFRGYLLPRMANPRWAPLFNSVLFCLYHLHSPWQFAGRVLGFTPLAYVVAWKKNIGIAIVVHCALDALSAAVLLGAIFR